MKAAGTIVIGLGNPILGDDGVGWQVAEGVRAALRRTGPADSRRAGPVEVDSLSVGGLALMERLIGYRRAILVDALVTGAVPGQVFVFALEELPDHSGGHMNSAHDTTLANALRVGRTMGAVLPEQVLVVGVEARSLFEFAEELTPQVAAAVPSAVQAVLDLLFPDGAG